MRKLKEYTVPPLILLLFFYITACLCEGTIHLHEMNQDARRVIFGAWLGVSTLFAIAKTLIYDSDNKKEES